MNKLRVVGQEKELLKYQCGACAASLQETTEEIF